MTVLPPKDNANKVFYGESKDNGDRLSQVDTKVKNLKTTLDGVSPRNNNQAFSIDDLPTTKVRRRGQEAHQTRKSLGSSILTISDPSSPKLGATLSCLRQQCSHERLETTTTPVFDSLRASLILEKHKSLTSHISSKKEATSTQHY